MSSVLWRCSLGDRHAIQHVKRLAAKVFLGDLSDLTWSRSRAVGQLNSAVYFVVFVLLSRTLMTSESGSTPPVFSPASNDDDAPLPGGHRELDDHELRPVLTDYMTKHRQQVSLFTALYYVITYCLCCLWTQWDCSWLSEWYCHSVSGSDVNKTKITRIRNKAKNSRPWASRGRWFQYLETGVLRPRPRPQSWETEWSTTFCGLVRPSLLADWRSGAHCQHIYLILFAPLPSPFLDHLFYLLTF